MNQFFAILLTFLICTIMFGALHYYCYGKLIPDKLTKKSDEVVPTVTDTAEQIKETFYGGYHPTY